MIIIFIAECELQKVINLDLPLVCRHRKQCQRLCGDGNYSGYVADAHCYYFSRGIAGRNFGLGPVCRESTSQVQMHNRFLYDCERLGSSAYYVRYLDYGSWVDFCQRLPESRDVSK